MYLQDQPFAEHLYLFICFIFQDNKRSTLSALNQCQSDAQMEKTYCVPVLRDGCSPSTDVCKQKSHLHLLSLGFVSNSASVKGPSR